MADNEMTRSEVAEETPAPSKKDAPVKEKEKKANKKPGFFKRIFKYLRECKSEMKKIVWSSGKQTFNNTVLVIVAMIIIGAVVVGLDFVFSRLIEFLISL